MTHAIRAIGIAAAGLGLHPSAVQHSDRVVRAHVGKGIFGSRRGADGVDRNGLSPLKAEYESLGGQFVEHSGPGVLLSSVWLTGPVPRPHRNATGARRAGCKLPPARSKTPFPRTPP